YRRIRPDVRVVVIERDHVVRRGSDYQSIATGLQNSVNLPHSTIRFGEVLQQPTTEHSLKVGVGEGDRISIDEMNIDALLSIVIDHLGCVIHRDNVTQVLFGEPAAAGPEVEDRAFSGKPRLVPVCAIDELEIRNQPFPGS